MTIGFILREIRDPPVHVWKHVRTRTIKAASLSVCNELLKGIVKSRQPSLSLFAVANERMLVGSQ